LKLFNRCASANSFGETPSDCLKVRRKCDGLTFNRAARNSSEISLSKLLSISAQACRTSSAFALRRVIPIWGRHRKQARNPALSASAHEAKNVVFSRFGRRAAHEGLQ
jgi:hypothetical protein